MQIINVQQGTPEWHALRSRHFTASEAPVMMAASNKMRRDELLSMKATGSEREFSDWVQTNLFDKGHAQEATARVPITLLVSINSWLLSPYPLFRLISPQPSKARKPSLLCKVPPTMNWHAPK